MTQDDRLQANTLCRPGTDVTEKGRQLKQLRSGYLTPSGELIKPARNAQMKTAIDPNTARAATSQLFGYESLQAGQRFLTTLSFDSSVDEALRNCLIEQLKGTVRVGRSRSAQFGRVELTPVSDVQAQGFAQSQMQPGAQSITLWCLSDLALTDQKTGLPRLQPIPEHFGLSGGQLDLKRSFIRTRSYSPYNSYRQAFDSRRELIQQGSVLCFSGLDPLTDAQVQCLQQPWGSYSEAGLGHVMVQPDILVASELRFSTGNIPSALKKGDPKKALVSESPLLQWLQAQAGLRQGNDLQIWVGDLMRDITGVYQYGRNLNGITPEREVGPSASQWGVLYQHARDLRHEPLKLYNAMFEGDKTAICRGRAGSNDSWDLKVEPDADFARWLSLKLTSKTEPSQTAKLTSKTEPSQTAENDPLFTEKVALLAAEMRKPHGLKLRSAVQETQNA